MILRKVIQAQSISPVSGLEKKALLKYMILFCTKGESSIESPETLSRVLLLFGSYRFIQQLQQDTFSQLDAQHNTVIKDIDPLLLQQRRTTLRERTCQLTQRIFRAAKCLFLYAQKRVTCRGAPGESTFIILQGKVRIGSKVLHEGYHFDDDQQEAIITEEETYLLVLRQAQMNSVQQQFMRLFSTQSNSWLAKVGVLSQWDHYGLHLLALNASFQYYRTGQEVFRANQPDSALYFIMEGQVRFQSKVSLSQTDAILKRVKEVCSCREAQQLYALQQNPLQLPSPSKERLSHQTIQAPFQFFGEFEPLLLGMKHRMSRAVVDADSTIIMRIEASSFRTILAKYGNVLDFFHTISQRFHSQLPQPKKEIKSPSKVRHFNQRLSEYNIFKHKINFTYKKGWRVEDVKASATLQARGSQFSVESFSEEELQEEPDSKNIQEAICKKQFDFSYHQKMNRLFNVPQLKRKSSEENNHLRRHMQKETSFKEDILQQSILMQQDTQPGERREVKEKEEVIRMDSQPSLMKRLNSCGNLIRRQNRLKESDSSCHRGPIQFSRSMQLQPKGRSKSSPKKSLNIKVNPLTAPCPEVPRQHCKMTTKMFESRFKHQRAQMNQQADFIKQKLLSQMLLRGKKSFF